MLRGERALEPLGSIVDSFDGEAFRRQTFGEESAKLNVIVDDKNSIQARYLLSEFDGSSREVLNRRIYKSLLSFANLDRTEFRALLKS